MADVKTEVLVPEIAVRIYVKFQQNQQIVWVEQEGGTNVSTVRCQGE